MLAFVAQEGRLAIHYGFKREAGHLATGEGISRKRATEHLSISVGALRNWIYQLARSRCESTSVGEGEREGAVLFPRSNDKV